MYLGSQHIDVKDQTSLKGQEKELEVYSIKVLTLYVTVLKYYLRVHCDSVEMDIVNLRLTI